MKKFILMVLVLFYSFLNTPSVFAAPDQFTFTDQTDVELNLWITSNAIRVSGSDAAVPASITGGVYSINDGEYTSDDSTVHHGDVITVQVISSESYATTTEATLTIGDVSDTFSITTKSEPELLSECHDCGHCDYDGHCDGGCHCEGEIHCDGDGDCHCGGICYCDDDDDHVVVTCFIATAAFGSPLARQVEILRQFRDRYLLTHHWGKKFVAWYNKNGPVAAKWIQDKPLAKAAVQTALYPLIGISFLLISGYLPWIVLGLLSSTLIYLRIRSKQSNDM